MLQVEMIAEVLRGMKRRVEWGREGVGPQQSTFGPWLLRWNPE